MKTGKRYLESPEKRAFDVAFGYLFAPLEVAATTTAALTFAEKGKLYHTQQRIGQYGRLALLKKIRTLDDAGVVLSPLADTFRAKAMDELPQLAEIRNGTMSVVGRRKLIPEEFDQLKTAAKTTVTGRNLWAKWEDIVLPAKPGLLSTFALNAHANGYATDVTTRLRADIIDHHEASISYDTLLLLNGLNRVVQGELSRGSVSI